jgi:hypothetical protein
MQFGWYASIGWGAMRTRVTMVLLAAACFAAIGCGEPSDSTPVACLEGPGAYVKALAAAPGAVRLNGETPISDCLAENQKAGDLATVGTALVAAATRLNAEARAEPGGNANQRLGYLLGATERGAQDTNGIHADLIRRLVAAARYTPDNRPLPPTFLRTYREGFDAGEARG